MALRNLSTVIGVKDNATMALGSIDTTIDGIRDNLTGTQDDLSGLTHDTGEFGYQASKNIDEVTGKTGELEEQTRGFGDTMRSAKDWVVGHWKEIAAGATAAGVAVEAFVRSQQDSLLAADNLAYSLGVTSEEARQLVYDISDVTMSVEDTLGVLTVGRQQQLKSADALEEYAGYWSMVSDVTGESAPVLAKASSALRGMGIEVGHEAEALSAFGYIHQETTSSVLEFMTMLERTGPEIREMGIDIDDTAAILGLMEHELGMTSRKARMEFRKAVNEADGELGKFLQTLGLSESQFIDYQGQVAASSTVMKDLDEQYVASRTSMQKFQAEVEKTIHLYGGHFMPLIEMASPLFMGLGVILGMVAAAKYVFAGATLSGVIPALIGATTAAWAFTAALLANPITWIVAAIVGLGVVIWQLWKNWDKVSAWFSDKWDWILEKVNNVVGWFEKIDLADIGMNIIRGFADGITSGIKWIGEAVKGVGEAVIGGIKGFFGIASPSTLMMEYGLNLGEGLNLGMKEETGSPFKDLSRLFSPEREPRVAAAAGGAYSPTVNITVNGGGDAQGIATAIDRRLRQTFDRHAERYFGRQRRRR